MLPEWSQMGPRWALESSLGSGTLPSRTPIRASAELRVPVAAGVEMTLTDPLGVPVAAGVESRPTLVNGHLFLESCIGGFAVAISGIQELEVLDSSGD